MTLTRSRIAWVAGALLVLGVGLWAITLLPIADPLPPQLDGWRTVGSYFDRPPGYPGKPWTKDGRSVSATELEAIAGGSHCGWDSATLMFIGWPPGTDATSSIQGRLYVRDPHGVMPAPGPAGSWARNPTLPPDARDTGYRYGALKLYLAQSDQDAYVYLIAPADRERWPRGDPKALCD